jgi:hypothetical protein
MALIELAKVIAADPAASRRWAAEPLPLTDRLTAVLTSRFAALPDEARAALLLAAVADGPDLRAAASHGAGSGPQTLEPASSGIRWRNMNELVGKPCRSTTSGAPGGPASR